MLMLVVPRSIHGQDISTLPGQWMTFRAEDGLPSNKVLTVWADPNGVVWSGTDSGLARFDGMRAWEPIKADASATRGAVRAIWGPNGHDIWVAGDAGLAHFDGRSWRQVPPAETGLPDGPLYAVGGSRRGDLWAGGAGGVAHYDGKVWRAFTAQDSPLLAGTTYAIAAAPDGQAVWFGTDQGLIRYDSGSGRWSQPPLPEGAGAPVPVPSLLLRNDVLFVGTWNGLLHCNLTNEQCTQVGGEEWNGPDNVNGIAAADDEIWITVSPPQFMASDAFLALIKRSGGGLRHSDGSSWGTQWLPGGGWEKDPRAKNMAGDKVNAIWLDGHRILWAATNDGLWRYDSERWRAYPEATGEVLGLWSADDGLWIVAKGAIRRFDGKQWQTLTTVGGRPVDRFRYIWSDGQGTAWVGGADGLVRIDGNRWQASPLDTTVGGIVDLWGRSTKDVWAVTDDGVAHFDGQGWQLVYRNAHATTVMGDGKNGLWLGMDKGLYHYDGIQWRDVTTDTLKTATFVTALLQTRDDKTWVGTEQGLYCFGCSDMPMQFKMAPPRALFASSSGALWFAAWDKSVDRWDQRLPGGKSGQSTGFSLVSTSVCTEDVRAIGEYPKGDIWMATDKGLLRHRSRPPLASVTGITLARGRPTVTDKQQYVLPYRHDAVTVTLAATDTGSLSSDMTLWYRLKGKDSFWTQWENAPFQPPKDKWRQIPYPKLAPGDYEFEFVVYNRDHDMTPVQSQALSVNRPGILDPDNPLFYVLLAGAGLLLVVGGGGGLRMWQSRRAYGYCDTELVVQATSVDAYQVTWQEPHKTPVAYPTQLKRSLVDPYLVQSEGNQISGSELRQLGQLLFDALFSDATRQELLVATRAGHKGRRLRLNFTETPQLLTLPWEFAHGAAALEFLGVNPNTALVRYLPPAEELGRPKTKWPLDVLVVWAEPRDLPPVEAEREVATMHAAVEALEKAGRLRLRLVPHATLEAFGQAVSEGTDVIHFIGHGGLEAGQNVLYFEDEYGDSIPQTADELGATFRGFQAFGDKAPKLVVLSACRSGAMAPGSDTLSGLAPALLQQGRVPAVVGMQYPVGAEVAARFADHFYHALVSHGGGQVDYAASVARKALYAETGAGRRDWGAPVVFMQVEDGHVFEVL